jgi:hypothetical protein
MAKVALHLQHGTMSCRHLKGALPLVRGQKFRQVQLYPIPGAADIAGPVGIFLVPFHDSRFARLRHLIGVKVAPGRCSPKISILSARNAFLTKSAENVLVLRTGSLNIVFHVTSSLPLQALVTLQK